MLRFRGPRDAQAMRRWIRLPVLRRLLALMDGQHAGVSAGHGQDFLDLAEYKVGDDVKDIDWKTSARHGRPVVKRFESRANVQLVLAVDTGRTMGAQAAGGEPKIDVAAAACAVVAWLSTMRGDQVGLVAGNAGGVWQVPARSGNAHADMLLRRLDASIGLDRPGPDLGRVLARVDVATRRRSLVVIVSDQTQPGPEAESVVKRLCVRHQVMMLAVEDLDPTRVDARSDVVDVMNGPLPDFVLGDEELGREARYTVDYRKAQVARMLARRGVVTARVAGSGDVGRALADALERSGRARR